MEKDRTPDAILRMRVDEVIHYLWDPIGVCDEPAARDEYYSYSAQAFGLLKNGATAPEIAKYLQKARVERMEMGRGNDLMSEDDIANLLIKWKETILE